MLKQLTQLKKNQKKIIVALNDFFFLSVSYQIFLSDYVSGTIFNALLFTCFIAIYFVFMEVSGGFSEVIKNYSAERLLIHAFPIAIFSSIYLSAFFYESINLEYLVFQSWSNLRVISFAVLAGFTASFTLITFSRVVAKIILYGSAFNPNATQVYIFGIGPNARELYSLYSENGDFDMKGFITLDKENHGRSLFGKEIISLKKAQKKFKKNSKFNVFLALEGNDAKNRSHIINTLSPLAVTIKSIPTYADFLEKDKITLEELSEGDILGREERIHDKELIRKFFYSKKILITGAGGSIGSELSKILVSLDADLLFLDSSELNLYKLQEFFLDYKIPVRTKYELADIRDKERLRDVFENFKPDFVFHAAAYKHVPILEENGNFAEAIKTNIFGTLNLASLSNQYNVERFILVSTDKAVRPTNLMGASKRISERLIATISETSRTIFSSVRFGNVLKSSGSVIPKFKDQIQSGGPVTVTHKNMTRYFMTISEAATLVINAGMLAKKYDTFLLKMGDPVKIYDLARKMINLYGFDVADGNESTTGIEIIFTGLRSGEKIEEELLVSGKEKSTENEMIFRDECNSELSKKDFDLLMDELDKILLKSDLNGFKKICKDFADYQNS